MGRSEDAAGAAVAAVLCGRLEASFTAVAEAAWATFRYGETAPRQAVAEKERLALFQHRRAWRVSRALYILPKDYGTRANWCWRGRECGEGECGVER